MHLDAPGHPLHTRALAVTLRQRADAALALHASVLDLRKRGFVPVGGDLQGPGIIHQMQLDGVVDPATTTLTTVRAAQPTVAFEASATSAGESCRDPIGRVDALAGTPLDDGFARAVGTAIGGPRGCSHILTLTHLVGSTVAWALARERALHATPARRRADERVFTRDVVVDGHEAARGRLLLAVQLTDLHFAPAPALARPMDRFAAAREVRLRAEVDLARFALVAVAGAERVRSVADLATAAWQDKTDALAPLAGLGLGAGVSGALLARFGPRPDDRPLLDALLMLAPALIQCIAALSDGWQVSAAGGDARADVGGLPDSCYMWRRGGALLRARDPDGSA